MRGEGRVSRSEKEEKGERDEDGKKRKEGIKDNIWN